MELPARIEGFKNPQNSLDSKNIEIQKNVTLIEYRESTNCLTTKVTNPKKE